MKNHAYLAVVPQLTGTAKQQTSVMAHPIYPYSIQGFAFPILLCVLSIIDPKNISVKPSNNFDTAIRVPTTPAASHTESVK